MLAFKNTSYILLFLLLQKENRYLDLHGSRYKDHFTRKSRKYYRDTIHSVQAFQNNRSCVLPRVSWNTVHRLERVFASARWRVLKGDLPVLTTRKPSEEIRGRRTKCKNEPVSHPSLDGSWHLTLILLALSHPATKGSNQVGVACAVIDPLFFVERIINQSFCLK